MNKIVLAGIILGILVIFMLGCVEKENIEVIETPTYTPESKYNIGDIIMDKTCNLTLLILDYDNETDKYFATYVSKLNDTWFYTPTGVKKWYPMRDIESYYPYLLANVDIFDVVTYEKVKRIEVEKYCEGLVSPNYYEVADKLIENPKEHSIQSLYEILMKLKLPEYKENEFMCGHASTYLEWYLEGAGFNTSIVSGYIYISRNPNIVCFPFPTILTLGDFELHSWIMVYLPEGMVAIESTYLCEGDNYLSPAIVIDKERKFEIYSFTYHEYYENYLECYEWNKKFYDEMNEEYNTNWAFSPLYECGTFEEFLIEEYCWNVTSLSEEYYDYIYEELSIYEYAYTSEKGYYEWWNKSPYNETINWRDEVL